MAKQKKVSTGQSMNPKNARSFLQGSTPGVMASYAPDAYPSPEQGWVESEYTVEDLVEWRQQAIT